MLLPWRISRLVAVGALLLHGGCRPSPPVQQSAKPPLESKLDAEVASANVTIDPVGPELELAPESTEEASAPVSPEVEPETDPLPDPNPPEKLLLMTTAGPLRVDIRVWIDEGPHPQAMESLVDRFLSRSPVGDEAESSDEQGELSPVVITWDQLLDQPAIKSGLYGNLGHETDSDRKQLLDRYDANRNGKVEPPELVRFLTRNRAAGRTFSIRPTAYAGDRQRESSPLWQWLDQNGDGRLDPGELAAASQRLRVTDLNDDELVTREEIQQALASASLMPGMEPSDPRRFQGSRSAYLLEEETDWFSLLDGIERIYQFGAPASWSLLGNPAQLATLDPPVLPEARVQGKEIPRLRELPAELLLEVRLGAEDQPLEVKLADSSTSGWEIDVKPGVSILTGPGGTIVFRLRDLPGSERFEAEVEQFMASADLNGDGYLTQEEYRAFPGPLGAIEFDAADQDGDGQLYPEEIREAMMAQRLVEKAQVRIQSLDGVDPLFWQLDENRDGRLSAREIAGTEEKISGWVTRADQSLQVEQIPGIVVFEIYRGQDDVPGDPLRLELGGDPATTGDGLERPAWHVAMDTNADGDVSRREFLGTDAQFQALDQDADGLISPREAAFPFAESDS